MGNFPYSPRAYGHYYHVGLAVIPLADVEQAVKEFTDQFGHEPELIYYPKESEFPPEFTGSQTVERRGSVLPLTLWVGDRT